MSSAPNADPDEQEAHAGTDCDHARNASFDYPWIDSTRQIRLLRIESAAPSRIECTWTLAQVSELRDTEYATLSYYWGLARTDKDIHEIFVAGRPFWVRTNLWNFLQCVHNFDIRKPIYIDAICLNQSNYEERGNQVKLMSDVYSNADHTHVWLGPLHSEQEVNLQALRTQLSERVTDLTWETEAFVGLSFLFSRIYWRRLWIVQELLLSHAVTFYCGNFVFDWQELAQLARLPLSETNLDAPEELSWWEAWSFKRPTDHSHEQAVEGRLLNGWQPALRLFHYRSEWLSRTASPRQGNGSLSQNSGLPFHQAITAFKPQQCGDRRDKIFALVGLLDAEGKEMVSPNYQSDLHDVFVQAAAAIIVSCSRNSTVTRTNGNLKYDSRMHCDTLNAMLRLDPHDIDTRVSRAMRIAMSYLKDRPNPFANTTNESTGLSDDGISYTITNDVQMDLQSLELNIDIPATQTALQQSFALFKNELTDPQRADFAATECKDLNVTIAAIQNKQRATGTLQNMTRIRAFMKSTEEYAELLDDCTGERHIIKFIWGSMRHLLQVTIRKSEAFDGLLTQYERLGESLPALTQIKSLEKEEDHRRELVGIVFRNVFEFHRLALFYFKKPAWQELFSSSWKQLENKLGEFITDIRKTRALIDDQANSQEMEESRLGRSENRRHFSELLERMHRARKANEERFNRLDEDEVIRRRNHVFNWLGAPDTVSDHDRRHKARKAYPTSGQWLLKNARFRAWFDPQSVSAPLLWITGKPGAGKSVLASLVIDEAKQLPETTTLYFYCNHDEPEKASFLGMARSVLHQLLLHDDTLQMYLFDVATKRGEITLRTVKLAKEVLKTCLKAVGKTYIIIDGLDECQPSEQQQHIAKFWMKYVETSGSDPEPSRCALLGQDDETTRPLFGNKIPTIRVQGEAHNQDISSYCLAATNEIPKRFALTPADRAQIASQTSQRAQGMFLFARLVMVNLSQQATREDLNAELDPDFFPDGINSAYARIIERILVQAPPSYRKHARRLLAWTCCATRVLKWREIQAAVSIDLDKQMIDFERLQLAVDAKALCGSLIEELPNGDVTFVHSTVKPYLLKNKHVNPEEQHTSTVELALNYFCLPAFSSGRPDDLVRTAILSGTYAFAEYALISWTGHLEEILAASPEPTISPKLAEALDAFFSLHWRYPRKRSKPTKRITELTDRIDHLPCYDRVLESMSSIHCLMSTNLSDPDAVQTSDIFMTMARVRTLMEGMVSQPDAVDTLKQFYGAQLFKCPRIYCKWFHEGFPTADKRRAHIDKHERSHYCSTSGCVYATLGFPTAKELSKHVADLHKDEDPTEEDFPPETMEVDPPQQTNAATETSRAPANAEGAERAQRSEPQRSTVTEPTVQQRREPVEPVRRRRKGPTTYQCEHCEKTFKRAFGLRSHLKTHTDEMEFTCGVCGKEFARKNDWKRHENSHNKEKKFVCRGTLKNGGTWGCGRDFARRDALGRHFQSETGRACKKPELDEQREEEENRQRRRQQWEAMASNGYATSMPPATGFNASVPEFALPGIQAFDEYMPNSTVQYPGWTYPTASNGMGSNDGFGGFHTYREPTSMTDMYGYQDQMGYGQPSSSRRTPYQSVQDSGFQDDYEEQ